MSLEETPRGLNYGKFTGADGVRNMKKRSKVITPPPNPNALVANLANIGDEIITRNKKLVR